MHFHRCGQVVILLSILMFVGGCSSTKKSSSIDVKTLEQNLNNLVTPFRGDVGIYAKNLKTGEEIAINADVLFPTASTVKVPILLTLFQKI